MYKLLYPSIRVRTAPPVSVRVRTRVSVSFSFTVLHVPRTFVIADLCDSGPESVSVAVSIVIVVLVYVARRTSEARAVPESSEPGQQ